MQGQPIQGQPVQGQPMQGQPMQQQQFQQQPVMMQQQQPVMMVGQPQVLVVGGGYPNMCAHTFVDTGSPSSNLFLFEASICSVLHLAWVFRSDCMGRLLCHWFLLRPLHLHAKEVHPPITIHIILQLLLWSGWHHHFLDTFFLLIVAFGVALQVLQVWIYN